jgi:hypothetical protein
MPNLARVGAGMPTVIEISSVRCKRRFQKLGGDESVLKCSIPFMTY